MHKWMAKLSFNEFFSYHHHYSLFISHVVFCSFDYLLGIRNNGYRHVIVIIIKTTNWKLGTTPFYSYYHENIQGKKTLTTFLLMNCFCLCFLWHHVISTIINIKLLIVKYVQWTGKGPLLGTREKLRECGWMENKEKFYFSLSLFG